MTYSEQIRHPSGALNPPQEKKPSVSLWWYVAAVIAAFILVAVIRPQWLAKIGIQAPSGGGAALGDVSNPHGWV
jgi:hypothetical protein